MSQADWIAQTKADIDRLEDRIAHHRSVADGHRAAGLGAAADAAEKLLDLMALRLKAQRDRLQILIEAEAKRGPEQ